MKATVGMFVGLVLAPLGCSSYRIVTPRRSPAGAVVNCRVDQGVVQTILGFGPGGHLVVQGYEEVYLFDATTGRVVKKIDGWRALMSPKGLLAIGHRPRGVSLYDLSKGQDHRIFRLDFRRDNHAFVYPTGLWDVRGGVLAAKEVLWDARTGMPGRSLGRFTASRGLAALSPDGKQAVSHEGSRVTLWDVDTGGRLWTSGLGGPQSTNCYVTGAKFGAGGKVLLVTVCWTLTSMQAVRVVCATRVLDAMTGKDLRPPTGGRLSGDANTLVECDKRAAISHLIALPSCRMIAALHAGNPVLASGAPVIAGRCTDAPAGEQWFGFWNTNTGRQLARIRVDAEPPWSCHALDPTGRFLICKGGGTRLCILDRMSGLKIAEIHAIRYRVWPPNFAYRRAFSADGKKAAVGLDDKVLIIDMAKLAGAALRSKPAGPAQSAVGYTPTPERPVVPDVGRPGSYVLFGGQDGSKRIRIAWPKGALAAQVSQGGKAAAAFVKSDAHKQCSIEFYDCQGRHAGTAVVPFWYRHMMLRMWVGDRNEAIVHLVGYEYVRKGKVARQPPGGVETFHVNARGEATALGLKHVADATFTTSPGFAVILGDTPGGAGGAAQGQTAWRLRRHDAAAKLLWEVELPDTDPGLPGFRRWGERDAKTIFSVWCNNWRAIRHYRRDGSYAAEKWPPEPAEKATVTSK